VVQGSDLAPRLLCAALARVLEDLRDSSCPCDLWFVFSAQGELGYRGLKAAAGTVAPERALAVTACDAGDWPGSKDKHACAPGKGVGIRFMDNTVISSPRLAALLEKTARENNILFQKDTVSKSPSGGGRLQSAGIGAETAVLSIPVRYRHTPWEQCLLADLDACAGLLSAICRTWGDG